MTFLEAPKRLGCLNRKTALPLRTGQPPITSLTRWIEVPFFVAPGIGEHPWAGLLIGVASHRRVVSPNTIAYGETWTNRPARPPFSLMMARQRRSLAA
jgi:hypothetical protein